MEDHKLKVFCTVAETKSFSKTSEIIHLTQPAVSLQIQALEEIYETKLFDRSSSFINLTPSGEILYRYAKDILTLYAEAEKEIGKITGLIKGSITIGASTTIGNYILPTVIANFKKTHPKIKINLLIGNTKRIVDFLNSGIIDLGLVEGETSRHKMKIDSIIPDELSFIVPPFHPWAKKKVVSILEVTKEPFILREEGSGTRQMIEKYLSSHGINTSDMRIALVLGSTESIKEAVESGIGISIVSKWAARKEVKYGSLKLITPKEEKILRSFSLIMQKNAVLSHAVDEFLAYLKAYPYDSLLSEGKV
ncbi:MAG: selenium metabolism-associated LysR family transcriptional regulator [Nitrospirae bacterium]|nr:selenium metabolism-associated LysR family transcriptional regulator [Nitrospirota bacterium]MDA8214819.1 selenium metabolism-associated LysR family transcriptional regulator [Nitrospiraceae bacterium]